MSHYIFEGKYQDRSSAVKVRLLLFHFQDENKVHLIYSPHLDLTGYGNIMSEARESFEIAFVDFIDYTIKEKTLAKVLKDLGWKISDSEKHPKKVIAPGIASVINDNEYVSEIFDKYPVKTYHKQVEIPICA